MSADTLVRLADYKPPLWSVDAVELRFELFSGETLVHAQLSIQRSADAGVDRLCWPAVAMEIQQLAINGTALPAEAWSHQDGELVIETAALPDDPSWTLETRVRLDPASNTSLEGLYVSGGLFTTQCEAEGFRRIIPFPDRPDVLSRYRVRIEADQTDCPVLLSNGNCTATGESSRGASFRRMGRPLPQAFLSLCLGGGPLAGGA